MDGKKRTETATTPFSTDTDARDPARNRAAAGAAYTLRIVFSGIVPLVPESDGDGKLKTFWVLVSNLTDPAKLPALPGGNGHGSGHSKMPPHKNRFLVPEGHLVSAGGRTVHRGGVCGEGGTFELVELANEHLSLDVDSPQKALAIVQDAIQRPVPCDPGTTSHGVTCAIARPRADQERDFQWTVSVDAIAAGLTKPGQTPPRIRKDLFATPYTPPGFPLISARFAFDRGTVAARNLDRQPGGDYRVYLVPPLQGTTPIVLQAVSTQAELVLPVRGPVTFRSRSLDGASPDPAPIVVDARGARELTLFLENEPDVACSDPARRGSHFVANFHLLDAPGSLQDFRGPEDTSPGPSLNGQCSPPTFSLS